MSNHPAFKSESDYPSYSKGVSFVNTKWPKPQSTTNTNKFIGQCSNMMLARNFTSDRHNPSMNYHDHDTGFVIKNIKNDNLVKNVSDGDHSD